MNEDSPDTVLDDDELNALLERPFTELSVDELMAMKAAYAARGIQIYNSLWASPEMLALMGAAAGAAAIYTKAVMETLGRRSGEALADLIHIRKNGATTEAHIGLPGDEWPKVVIAPPMPDEAWLAMFDIADSVDELRGKTLRWDSPASAWRADPDE